MVRRLNDQTVEYKCIRGGIGEARMRKVLSGEEEMYSKGRMFNVMTLAPGNSIGEHTHTGDNEIFLILSGSGEYNDNGIKTTVNAGDVCICNSGEMHGFVNNTDEPLTFVALILY